MAKPPGVEQASSTRAAKTARAGPAPTAAAARRRPRLVAGEPLRVAPQLLGTPLASPGRRLLAAGLDAALLFVPSLLVALVVSLLGLRLSDASGYRALLATVRPAAQRPPWNEVLRDLAPLLVRVDAPGLPDAVRDAVRRGDLDAAAAALESVDLLWALAIDDGGGAASLRAGVVRIPLERFIPAWLRAVATFGVAALYFTVLLVGPRGATVGKRVLGIRVVRLDGRRLGLLESFERFAGYLQVPGSFGFALADLWRDPLRRMPHDRVVNTVVVTTARPRRGAPPTPRPASIPASCHAPSSPAAAREVAPER